ncbi:MAG: Gfo/Idh/MocA family oxidoreductase [Planctomycetes bacterium]|nr:Gfo/Idh/MocA family oxidoreductase [Planctomycetota bacterium]
MGEARIALFPSSERRSTVTKHRHDRREFLKTSAAAFAAGGLSYWVGGQPAQAFNFQSPNERPVVGCIGTGDRWKAIGPQAMKFGDVVAVCDVDSEHAGTARDKVRSTQGEKGRTVDIYEDYRQVLDRKDVQVVTIVTPDHWHSKIAIAALKAGKDIYCEKPLTLTIDEGKQIIKVLDETKRVFQVGTQQRSEMNERFLTAVALVRAGRIGKLKTVQCAIGGAPKGGPFAPSAPPSNLNWDMWLGQTPLTDYMEKRVHYEFRWWYEYSGGKMTDWGAHHVDIAQWAMGMENSGPSMIEGTATHPCPFKDGHPTESNIYNTATEFSVRCLFPNGVEMTVRHDTENGIRFTGDQGSIFVSRGKLTGQAVDDLKTNPLPENALTDLCKGKKPGSHMGNFFECVKTRDLPISDVYTHHRAMTTCHLANIAIRLGRKLQWDPKSQMIIGDQQAQTWQAREQRKGYEVVV